LFVEGKGRIDTLMKVFAYFPDKTIRYIVRKRGKVIVRFLITEGSSGMKNIFL